MRVLSSKTQRRRVGFESPPSKPVKPNPPEEHEHSGEFSSFSTRFQLDFADFVNQNNQIRHKYNRSGDSQHDLGEKSSELKKSLPDPARSHRILAGSGEISSIFNGFRRVSASPETDPTRQTSNPRNLNLLMGRL